MTLQLRFSVGAITADTDEIPEGGGSGAPDFLSLPALSRQAPNASLFASRRALASGATFTDPTTGVTILKLTDATTDPSSVPIGYAEGGPFISQKWGGNMYTVRVGAGVLVDVNADTRAITNRRTVPGADVGFGFSMDPTTPRLAYYLSGSRLYAYDTETNAAITTTHIASSGRDFASTLGGTPFIEWLTVCLNGWVTFQANDASLAPNNNQAVCFFNVLTGETVTNTLAGNNQLHPSRDGAAAFMAMNDNGTVFGRIWRRATNDFLTLPILDGGHPAALIGAWYDINPHGSSFGTTRYRQDGTATELFNNANVRAGTGTHHAGQYPQVGTPVLEQWALADSVGAFRAAPTSGWTLESGQVYRTVVDWAPAYQKPTIGIRSVYQHTSSPNTLTNTLTEVGSLGAMVEGSFFYNGGTETLYVWVVGGGSPLNKVVMLASAGNQMGLAFMRIDGTEARLLCHHGNYNWTSTYNEFSFGTWSPDGRLCYFQSTWGVSGGRRDGFVAFVPGTV
jgi:hypothetical protein